MHFHLLHGNVQGQCYYYYLLNCFLSQSACPKKYLTGFNNTLETTCCNCKSNWSRGWIKVPVFDYEHVGWGQLSWTCDVLLTNTKFIQRKGALFHLVERQTAVYL